MSKNRRFLAYLSLATALFFSNNIFAATVTRGPYLQTASDTTMTFRWRTDSNTDSVVHIGSSPDNLNQAVSVAGNTTEHSVEVSGLKEHTQYYYSIGSSNEVLAGGDSRYRFTTSPVPGTSVATRVWLIGDAGTADSNQAAVYNAYLNYPGADNTDLWIMLGDNAYNNGTDSEYQRAVFDMYPELLRRSPVWATLGNHDGYRADSSTESGPYYDIFTLPRNGEAGGVASGTEAYYSFDYGDIHFICLDSYDSDRSANGAMMTWLENDLSANDKNWLVAFWHHPPYTKGSHNSDSESALREMREVALPILEDYGVDLVLSGHSHSYERSYFIDSHYGNSSTFSPAHQIDGGDGREDGSGAYHKDSGQAHAGTVYTVAGSSGKTSGGALDHPAMFTSRNELGSVVLDIYDNRLDAKFLRSDGSVTDYYTVTKGVDTTPPALDRVAASNDIEVEVFFSEPVDSATAENPNHYSLDKGVEVESVSAAGNAVTLTTSGLSEGETYTLTVNNVEDVNGNVIAANSQADFRYSNIQTVSFQDGVNNYTGTRDTWIGSGVGDRNFGAETSLLADGADGGNGETASLVAWDLSAIPAGATITGARVELTVYGVSNDSYNLYAGDKSWSENSATWNSQDPYNSRGGVIGRFVPSSNGTHSIPLNATGIATLQEWVDGGINGGVYIMTGGGSDGLDMRSSEYSAISERPRLVVSYAGGGSSGEPVTVQFQQALGGYTGAEDTYVASGSTDRQWGGSTALLADGNDWGNGELISLLKWDVSSLPVGANVISASITLQVFNRSNDTYNLWEMLAGWSEASATWDNTDPAANRGAQVGSFNPTSTGAVTINLNATGIALVQRWIEGAENNGITVQSGGTSDGIDIRSSEYDTQSQRPLLTITYE